MTDHSFSGRLFGPGLPGVGVPAIGQWRQDGQLQVIPTEPVPTDVLVGSPTVAAGGFNAAGLRLSCSEAAGDYAFIIETDVDRQLCAIAAPPALTHQLTAAAGVRNRLERRFRLGGVLLVLFLALPLIGIVLFLFNSDRIVDWAVTRITTAQEARLGDLVLAQSRLQMKILDNGPAVDAVRAIGTKLTTGSVHRYRWYVADRPDINAFAAPGGVVVVNRGLIRSVASAEELAGVLAHEIAHVELRHSLRGMIKSLGLRALVSLLVGDISGSIFTDAATRLTELRFSRAAEQEADADGLRRLISARIDPNGMVRFYDRLAKEKLPTPPLLLSTHPTSGERRARLQRKIDTLSGTWTPLPVNLKLAKENLLKSAR